MKAEFTASLYALRPMLKWISDSLVGMPPSILQQIELACEELFVNILQHAYQKKGGLIEITVQWVPQQATLIFKDRGPPFNLLDVEKPNLDAPLEQREAGGLGIHLIRSIMDEVHYAREGGHNVVTLIKKL